MPSINSGSPTMSRSVILGLSDENGSWKIICISRRRLLNWVRGADATSTTDPSGDLYNTSPLVGSTARSMHLEVVVFPHPLSPTSPSVSPSLMSKLTSSTARMAPTSRRSRPCLIGKYLRRLFISSSVLGDPFVSADSVKAHSPPCPFPDGGWCRKQLTS